MGCCGKTLTEVAHIAEGFTRLATDTLRVTRKAPATDDRIRMCQRCKAGYWKGRTLWCKMCGCYVPAKARVQSEQCPLGIWKE